MKQESQRSKYFMNKNQPVLPPKNQSTNLSNGETSKDLPSASEPSTTQWNEYVKPTEREREIREFMSADGTIIHMAVTSTY